MIVWVLWIHLSYGPDGPPPSIVGGVFDSQAHCVAGAGAIIIDEQQVLVGTNANCLKFVMNEPFLCRLHKNCPEMR